MFNHLPQAASQANNTVQGTEIVAGRVSLEANFDLLLSLSIIPTLSGVALVV